MKTPALFIVLNLLWLIGLGCDSIPDNSNSLSGKQTTTAAVDEKVDPGTDPKTQLVKSSDTSDRKDDSSDKKNTDGPADEETGVLPANALNDSKTSPDLPSQTSPASKKGLAMSDKFNKLNEFESFVLLEKGTERAYTGEYWDNKAKGTYICRRCNAPLYKSDDKFESHCGWPSFDDEIKGAVTRQMDADGFRTEIICTNCGGHLGHVFLGERQTAKNTRHCVNSVSTKFVPEGEKLPETIVPDQPPAKSADTGKDLKSDKATDAQEQ